MQEIRGSTSVVRYRRVPLNIGWVVVRIVVNGVIPHKSSVTTQYVGRPFANAERDYDFQFGCLFPAIYHGVRRFG